jgi:hypothetical protein
MPKIHLLEPSEASFWRRRAVQPATLAGLGTRDAIAEVPEMPQRRVFENKAAVVPPPLLPRAIEPKEEAALAVSMSEAARLERKHMTEFEHSVPVTEPAHETSVAESLKCLRMKG